MSDSAPTRGIADSLSAAAFRIEACVDDTSLSFATGFLYRNQSNHIFLITNRHVLTGRDQSTQKPLHGRGGIPNNIRCDLPQLASQNEWKYLSFESALYDAHDVPRWIEHPHYKGSVDIGGIWVSRDQHSRFWTINDAMAAHRAFKRKPFELYPSNDGFILGFPLGIRVAGHLPIWKRCTIASEPDFLVNGLPQILVDTATRQGMSGSPVFAQITGSFPSEGLLFAVKRQFIGVYSGRFGQDEFQAQLGIVWKSTLVDELIASANMNETTTINRTRA